MLNISNEILKCVAQLEEIKNNDSHTKHDFFQLLHTIRDIDREIHFSISRYEGHDNEAQLSHRIYDNESFILNTLKQEIYNSIDLIQKTIVHIQENSYECWHSRNSIKNNVYKCVPDFYCHLENQLNNLIEQLIELNDSINRLEQFRRTISEYSACASPPLASPPPASPHQIGYDTTSLFPSKNSSRILDPNFIDGKDHLDISKVHITAIAPKSFKKGDYSLINILFCEEDYLHIIEEVKKESIVPQYETKSGIHPIEKGKKITVVLSSPDISIEDGTEEMVWHGGYLNFSFAVCVPESYNRNQLFLIASVYIDGIIVTKIKIIIVNVFEINRTITVSRNDILSAFISYASQDRETVVRLIQGMKKLSPNMDIFFDVEKLRSGEDWEEVIMREIKRRDVLFLCWSHYAKQSFWVDKEWRFALSNKGLDGIEPIPLESPNYCPPPIELQKKHFNDSLLFFIKEGISEQNSKKES